MQKLITLTPPAAEPVTLEDMKLHLRVTHGAEDAVLEALIESARVAGESFTGIAFIRQDLRLTLDRFEGNMIELPKTPVIAVTGITIDGLAQAGYVADLATARIALEGLPQPVAAIAGIAIDFTAGYGDEPGAVPAPLRQGIRQLVTRLFENRGEGMAASLQLSGAASLFQPYRRMRIA